MGLAEAVPEPVDDDSAPILLKVREKHPSSGRSRTIPNNRRLSRNEQKRRWDEDNEWTPPGPRPQTRGDCLEGAHTTRPCPWVSCSMHLYLDVDEDTGALKLNFPDLEVWQMPYSCALDEADASGGEGMTLEQVAERMSLTRERVRQLEERVKREARPEARRIEEGGPRSLVHLRVIGPHGR